MLWQTRRKSVDVARGGVLMGILNMTPDSFSDGGRHATVDAALRHAQEMEREGALIIDVGGESTRPGSDAVPEEEELRRVVPLVEALREQSDVLISVDTRKPEVARQALEAGADIINDIEGLASPSMVRLCADYGCGVVIMHMKGEPGTMQLEPRYDDVVGEVRDFFQERYRYALEQGVRPGQVCFDPGIGFGKRLEHNLELIANLECLRVDDRPILLALSRKRTLSAILDDEQAGRLPLSTAVMTVYGHQAGAQLHRVHDVKECGQALKLFTTVECYERG